MLKENTPVAIVVMGVSGAGKTSVGEMLAARLSCTYIEGDRLHPAANVEKMANGVALSDDDRWPWLDLIGAQLAASLARNETVVVSCSALRKVYRDRLRQASGGTLYIVYLKGTPEVLARRMGKRTGHFMPTSLLDSQLATLESPEAENGVVTVDIDAHLDAIVESAVQQLSGIVRNPSH